MTYTMEYHSPIGMLTVAAEEDALLGIWMNDQKYFAVTLPRDAAPGDTPLLRQACDWLDAYFADARPDPAQLPLRAPGSAFRQAVWELLKEIPYGGLTTYGAIAKRLAAQTGKRVSAQAVGGAVGHNPWSILVPCHRVVGSSGSLTGYAGGIDKKLWLLHHEGVDTARLHIPTKGTAL